MPNKKNHHKNHILRYEQYLSEDPDNIVLLTTLGDLYHQAGDLQQAVHCFKQCLALENDNLVANICLAKVLISGHRFHLAESLLRKLINNSQNSESIQHDLGLCLYYQQRWSEAEAIFDRIRHIGKDNIKYLVYCLHHQQQLGKAIALSKEWLKLSPGDATEGYISLLEMDYGSLIVAQNRARKVLSQSPTNIHANLVCGLNAILHQKWQQARLHLNQASYSGSKHPRVFLYLGLVNMLERNYASSIDIIRHINPNCAKALLFTLLGWCQLLNNKSLLAEEYFKRAIATDNGQESAYSGLCIVYTLQQLYSEAKECLRKSNAIDDQSAAITIATQFLAQASQQNNTLFFERSVLESLRESPQLMNYLKDKVVTNAMAIADLSPPKKKQHMASDIIMLMSQSTAKSVTEPLAQET